MNKTRTNPITDSKGFYEELQNESPRAAVIIAAAFLDAQLRNLISKACVNDSRAVGELLGTDRNPDGGPLSSFAAKTKAAYCLGLIGRSTYEDLNTIRKIRNKFAHKVHGYTFDEPEIVNWCRSLKLANMIADAIPDFRKNHGTMFLLGVSQLASDLAMKAVRLEQIGKPLPPKEPRVARAVRWPGDSKPHDGAL
jgi:DNA-binding MltR family transcriptional regulator